MITIQRLHFWSSDSSAPVIVLHVSQPPVGVLILSFSPFQSLGRCFSHWTSLTSKSLIGSPPLGSVWLLQREGTKLPDTGNILNFDAVQIVN